MATLTTSPKIKKAAKLLDRYAELHQTKLEAADAYKHSVAPLDAEMQELKNKLQDWADDNRTEFGDKKTMNLEAGTIGYKLGMKAVAFPIDAPADIKDKYFAIVSQELPTAIVESVDSKKVIGGWDHVPTMVKRLAKLGITVGQEDSFFITPKK